MDRMRESLFAILGDLAGQSFLDLYSGSGVVAVEAASRGADPVILVEKDPGKKRVIQRNTAFVEARVEIHILPVERFIRREERAFDLIYLDPPFARQGKGQVIEALEARGLLAAEGRLILHLPTEEPLPERIGRLALGDRRRYGGSTLLFYGRE
jgi:16S rRNA (guanine(966)-N(2))-methyltransferase RsmD